MTALENLPLEYGNWVRKRVLIILALICLILGALVFLPFGPYFRIGAAVLFAMALLSFLFPAYAFVMFSHRGGRFQEEVYALIVDELGIASGAVVDIGTGNGVLAVTVARANPAATVLGIDYWGRNWEYSQAACEGNAEAGGVADRVTFQHGDAATLDFADGQFDAAVSNLTFHEVRSVSDKRVVLAEALRVIRPGGAFVFVDYFYNRGYYGPGADFDAFLAGLGLESVSLRPLKDAIPVPLLLRHPRILGPAGILTGVR